MTESDTPQTFYDAVGGHETFVRITRRFYEQVAADPEFRALYPEPDLGGAEERLRMFLEQYWGGPSTYSQVRGHPRLRMRHVPFRITSKERDTWLRYMRVALDSTDMAEPYREAFWDYLQRAAAMLVNAADDPPGAAHIG